ncbi:MAG TPA: phosphoribosylformylglycinamidine synthase subunit PurS [Thermoanaerobaculia bacterium]|nr:phosphoribosylformylglycinamidine synthase subunit PurS [Thermoanaerobaculia bacterium]
MRVRVIVYPRREILDPQGKAIRDALERLGFAAVESVRAGKSFELEIKSDEKGEGVRPRVEAMCEKLLANTVVEDYEISILEAADEEEP